MTGNLSDAYRGRRGPKRALVVGHHAALSGTLVLLLRQILSPGESRPALVSRAATLAEGLRLASGAGPFDLAVVDPALPDGDGTEVVREIKAAYPRTRVAVLSSVSDLSGALSAGADEALHKSLPLTEIIRILARLVEDEQAA